MRLSCDKTTELYTYTNECINNFIYNVNIYYLNII